MPVDNWLSFRILSFPVTVTVTSKQWKNSFLWCLHYETAISTVTKKKKYFFFPVIPCALFHYGSSSRDFSSPETKIITISSAFIQMNRLDDTMSCLIETSNRLRFYIFFSSVRSRANGFVSMLNWLKLNEMARTTKQKHTNNLVERFGFFSSLHHLTSIIKRMCSRL